MQKRGLCVREECATDGRGANIVLTPGGLRTIEAAARLHVSSVRRHFIDLLSAEQIDTFGDTVVAHLTDRDPPSPGLSPSPGVDTGRQG